MDPSEDNVYILGGQFLEGDDQLLIQDDFSRGRKQIFTLEDMEQLEDEGILVEGGDGTVEDILGKPVKTEPEENVQKASPGTSQDGLPILRHFLLSDQDSPQFMVSDDDDADLLDLDLPKDESGCFVEHMDIRAPVVLLRTLLTKRLGIDLSEHDFWLQNAQKLEPQKNLVDQCVQGEGLVQINVEVVETDGDKRINIVDVLKPTEEFLQRQKEKSTKKSGVQWVVDHSFREELNRLKIPEDPLLWTKEQVKLWLLWAVRQFNLVGVKLSDWMITGKELCEMTFDTFKEKCKNDRGGIFWTHLELLRKCDLLAVVAKEDEKIAEAAESVEEPQQSMDMLIKDRAALKRKLPPEPRARETPKRSRILGSNQAVTERRTVGGCTKTGTNGQIQLWQFLLELLTDKNHQSVIFWVSSDGEFKLENPEVVAQLWGKRKQKPAMTYEKLSRALRYYYDGDMIAKVPGKRFVYKFVCDIQELLGYSASRLNQLVTESAMRHGLPTPREPEFYEHLV